MRAKLMGLFLLALVRLLTGSQARWYGCPPKAEQRIYFANHQSHADLVLIWAALPQKGRPPAKMISLHVWALSHGIASLFARGDAARRKLPMTPEDLLEAGILVYLRGLGYGEA